MPILNRATLLRNATTAEERAARALLLDALDLALSLADPGAAVERHVRREVGDLVADGTRLKLVEFNRVWVFGAGKAVGGMASTLERILAADVAGGVIIIPRGLASPRLWRVECQVGDHPLPTPASVNATRRLLEVAEEVRGTDLVCALFSGGGSALLTYPVEGVSVHDKARLTQLLLRAGANIHELNAVRKHLSQVKGGQLLRHLHGAHVLTLLLSDVVGDAIDVIASGPTAPDPTTYAEAIRVLQKYDLWRPAPRSVQRHLEAGQHGEAGETVKPDDPTFRRTSQLLVGTNIEICQALATTLQRRGLHTHLLTTPLTGEAREVGLRLAELCRRIHGVGEPVSRPALLIAGGETTVTVRGPGRGGRNQELTVAAVPLLAGIDGVAVGALATDGVDAATDAAGAVADGSSDRRARAQRLSVEKTLARNDSYRFFAGLGDLLHTGPTGTTVNDIVVAALP